MVRTVVKADAVKGRDRDNQSLKVAARDKGKPDHKDQENPRDPARAEARGRRKVRVKPNQHHAQEHNPEQAEIAMFAQATYPDTFRSPFLAVCHHPCIVQVAEDVI